MGEKKGFEYQHFDKDEDKCLEKAVIILKKIWEMLNQVIGVILSISSIIIVLKNSEEDIKNIISKMKKKRL